MTRCGSFSLWGALLALLASSGVAATSKNEGPLIPIVGWPSRPLDRVQPPPWLGDDPVLGRLACPPFSRLNLLKKKSEALIFQDVNEHKGPKGQTIWTYLTRPGIYWWRGQEVGAEDLASFIRSSLAASLADELSLWKFPSYQVAIKGQAVTVTWEGVPAVGPYLFNGLAFSRPSSPAQQKKTGLAYECAGVYEPEMAATGVYLRPNPGYKMMPRPNLLLVAEEAAAAYKDHGDRLDFVMAETFSVDPKVRTPSTPASCPAPLALPLLSAISWNTQRGRLADKRLRPLLTQLTPRGALLRAGAGHAGELLSSLIPREHPGYDTRFLVRPFQLAESAKALDSLGYVRAQGDKDRLDLEGKPFYLRLASWGLQPGLLEKVLADSFMAVGIHTQFVPAPKEGQSVDGVVSGIYLPWPGMNLLPTFHSRAGGSFPFWRLNDKPLDRELEAYAQELTRQSPDFQHLQRVHALLYQHEPMTILMQHWACLQAPRPRPGLAQADARDPDWFRKLIL